MSEKLSDIRETLGLAPVDADTLRRFGPPTYTEDQVRVYALMCAARAEARPAPVVDREAVALIRELADSLEAEITARAEIELPRRVERDMEPVRRAREVLALLSPATSPGEGSSSANRAARIASDHAASETQRKSEGGDH